MSVLLECIDCAANTVLEGHDELSDAELEVVFSQMGWSILPTLCPEHRDNRSVCMGKHDPTPFVNTGLQMGGGTVFGRKVTFSPRPEYCQRRSCYGKGA